MLGSQAQGVNFGFSADYWVIWGRSLNFSWKVGMTILSLESGSEVLMKQGLLRT